MDSDATSQQVTVVVELTGDLDFTQKERVLSLLPPPTDNMRVVIDCSTVTLMDSTILATLMTYRVKFIIASKTTFEIVCIANERIAKLFEVVGLSRYVTVIQKNAE